MKHNETIKKAAILGGAAMLLLAGCMKESAINEKYRPAGTPITFSATTGYGNGTGTRTEYSGQLYGDSPRYERIDWVEADPVTIAYVHGTTTASQYMVTGVSGDSDRNSTASVEVASGQTKLTWGEGDGDHTFYAMYPSNGFGDNTSASLTNGNHVTGAVPGVQTPHLKDGKYLPPMQYGYMVAYKHIEGTSHESRVTLPFTPAVTAFEFKLQKKEGDTGTLKVTGVELTATTPFTGTFSFDITGGNNDGALWDKTIGTGATTVTGTGNTVSFTFPEDGGVSLPEYNSNDFLDFTLFALPVEQTGLVLTLIYSDASRNTLALNDSPGVPHTFEAAKKHIITNKSVPGDWEYVIEATDPDIFPYTGGTRNATVTSYRQKGGVKEPVAWTVEGYYYDEECTQPVAQEDLWITSFNGDGTGEGSVTGESVLVVGQASTPVITETITPEAQALNALVAGTELGSAANPRNLSNPGGGWAHGTIEESANSYIVNQVGYYEIPLVMGNSIKNNAANPDEIAWKGYDGREDDGSGNLIYKNDWRVLFENYKGNHITDPWLKNQGGTPTSAEIVWEDVEGLVETDDAYNLENAISTDKQWLQFRIPAERSGAGIINGQNEPRQGNAVIAVKDENGTVIWSYHIWVTDYVPKNYPGYVDANHVDVSTCYKISRSNEQLVETSIRARLMKRPLGLTLYGRTKTTYYPAHRTIYAKLLQSDSGQEAVVLSLHSGDHTDVDTRNEGAPVYQYGRSAPLWPVCTTSNEDVWYGQYPSQSNSTGPLSISQTIQNPWKWVKPNSNGLTFSPITVSRPGPAGGKQFFPALSHYQAMPNNLWSARATLPYEISLTYSVGNDKISFGGNSDLYQTIKTVYDPNPSGYTIPDVYSAACVIGGFLANPNPHTGTYTLQFGEGPSISSGIDISIAEIQDDAVFLYNNPNQEVVYRLPRISARREAGLPSFPSSCTFFLSHPGIEKRVTKYGASILIALNSALMKSGISMTDAQRGYAVPILPMWEGIGNPYLFPASYVDFDDLAALINQYDEEHGLN